MSVNEELVKVVLGMIGTDVLGDMVKEMASNSDKFLHLEYFENNEDFFNIYFSDEPHKAVRACYFGDYRLSDDLVCFDGYENLESISHEDFKAKLNDEKEDIVKVYIRLEEGGTVSEFSDLIEESKLECTDL